MLRDPQKASEDSLMSVKLATATAADSASVTDFVQNGHMGAVWPPDSQKSGPFWPWVIPSRSNSRSNDGERSSA